MNNCKKGFSVQTLMGISLMCVLIILTGWIIIPSVIPFTMQTLGVFLAVTLLGTRGGSLSVVIYLLLGSLGLPVFAGMKGGVGVLLGPTGGYLAGFLPGAFLSGLCMGDSKNPIRMAASLALGLAVSYAVGTVWYCYGYTGSDGLWGAIAFCVVPYLLPDGIKILIAVLVTNKLRTALSRMGWKRW